MQAAKMAAMDKKEDEAELKEVEAMDAVNEESKAVVADILANKIAKKAEKDEAEIQQMIDMDNKEEKEELDAIADQKIVSPPAGSSALGRRGPAWGVMEWALAAQGCGERCRRHWR